MSNRVLVSRQNRPSMTNTLSSRQQTKSGASMQIEQSMESGANRDVRPMTAVSSAGFNSKSLGEEGNEGN